MSNASHLYWNEHPWSDLELRKIPPPAAAVEPLEVLRSLYAGVLLAGFEAAPEPFDAFVSRHRFDYSLFLPEFLSSAEVVAALPELQGRKADDLGFPPTGPQAFRFAAQIAEAIQCGGAYTTFAGTASDAMRLGQQLSDALVEGRYDEVLVYHSCAAWAPWFGDVAWDRTWVLVDRGTRRLWLLCATDMD